MTKVEPTPMGEFAREFWKNHEVEIVNEALDTDCGFESARPQELIAEGFTAIMEATREHLSANECTWSHRLSLLQPECEEAIIRRAREKLKVKAGESED